MPLTPEQARKLTLGRWDSQAMAGMTWEDAVSKRLVYNAAQAAKKLNLDGNALEAKWAKIDKKKDLVKFGGGFYCGKLEEKMFVINGFYMVRHSTAS